MNLELLRSSQEFIGMRIVAAFLFIISTAVAAAGREPAQEFVKGLQDRGLHDLALEYLEQLKTSPLADDAIRQQVPYWRGIALIEVSRQSPDSASRNRLLDQARQELEDFARTNPHNVHGAEAQLQLATVQLSRGQELVAQITQLPNDATYDAQRKTLGHDARVMFAEARDTFARSESIYSSELAKLPPTTSDQARSDTGSKRQEFRGRVAQLKFLAAQTQFEEAESYPSQADEFRKLHEAAAQELSAIYDEFSRTLLVGLYARLYEGRCYQAIGSYQLALGCYEEIIGKDNMLPPFRKLIASAVQRKAEVLIAQKKWDAAIEACKAGLRDARKDEAAQPEWLGLRYRFAEAISHKLEATKPDSIEQRRLLAESRDAYRFVAKVPGEFQLAARTAAATESGSTKPSDGSKDEPKTFQAAYDLGKEALSSYNSAKMALPSAEKNNPSAVPELQAQMEHGKEDARHYFLVASSLVDADTDPKLLNEVRYFLCWLYWESGDYYRAAVLGEFLARRFPDHAAASSAAKIAMASYERLLNQIPQPNKDRDKGDFEADHMARMAELITKRWSGSEDADAAFSVLVSYAIRSGSIEEAEKLIGAASAHSRPRLELQLGCAMWARYLSQSATSGTQNNEEALSKLKTQAVKYLQAGIAEGRKESIVSEMTAWAALYVAQAMLSDGKYSEAVTLLEDGKIGPLKLIADGNRIASRPQYAIEAYKAALRAYVSESPPDEKKSMETMHSLEHAVQTSGDAATSAEQLNRIYIGMGVALQKQIEDLRSAGKGTEAKRVAAAVATFLDRINATRINANWPTRVWLAQMYYSMATDQSGQSTGPVSPVPLTNSIRGYLTKARDIYLQLIKEAADNPKLAPSENALLAAKLQLGQCYRVLGEYEKALDTFAEILTQKEVSLDVQRAAALAYQERGQREDPKYFEPAIHGGYKSTKTNQNRIWGWLKISTVCERPAHTNEALKDVFFEARFNISRCRYLAGMKKLGEARKKDLEAARGSYQSFAQAYPNLGGDKWKPQFEVLQKQIQAGLKNEG
jgi:tetratricopeptide (TPR) repeat protein